MPYYYPGPLFSRLQGTNEFCPCPSWYHMGGGDPRNVISRVPWSRSLKSLEELMFGSQNDILSSRRSCLQPKSVLKGKSSGRRLPICAEVHLAEQRKYLEIRMDCPMAGNTPVGFRFFFLKWHIHGGGPFLYQIVLYGYFFLPSLQNCCASHVPMMSGLHIIPDQSNLMGKQFVLTWSSKWYSPP